MFLFEASNGLVRKLIVRFCKWECYSRVEIGFVFMCGRLENFSWVNSKR